MLPIKNKVTPDWTVFYNKTLNAKEICSIIISCTETADDILW